MRKTLPFIAASALLLLAGCSNTSSTTNPSTPSTPTPSTTAPSSTSSLTSTPVVTTPTPTTPTPTTPTPTTPTPTTPTPSTPVPSTPAPTTPLPVIEDYKQAILDLFNTAKEGKNYTYTHTHENAGADYFERRFTPNAYTSVPFIDEPEYRTNYAANSHGVFSFSIDKDGAISASSDYYTYSDGSSFDSIYDLRIVDRWDDYGEDDGYYKPILSLDNFEFTIDSMTGEANQNRFVIPNSIMVYLIPGRVISPGAQYNTCYISLGEDQKSLVLFNDTNYGDNYTLTISNIGTTEIPGIEEYLASGGGPSSTLTSPITTALESRNYVITKENEPIVYVNRNYTFNTLTNSGYAYIGSGLDDIGVYRISYAAQAYTLGEFTGTRSFFDSLYDVFGIIPTDILDSLTSSDDVTYETTDATSIAALHLNELLGATGDITKVSLTSTSEEESIATISLALTIGGSEETYVLQDFGTSSVQGIEDLLSTYTY